MILRPGWPGHGARHRVQPGAIGQLQLLQDIADMGAHCTLAESPVRRNLLISKALRYQLEGPPIRARSAARRSVADLRGRFNSWISFRAMLGCKKDRPWCTS